jgi:hypothetical protein
MIILENKSFVYQVSVFSAVKRPAKYIGKSTLLLRIQHAWEDYDFVID